MLAAEIGEAALRAGVEGIESHTVAAVERIRARVVVNGFREGVGQLCLQAAGEPAIEAGLPGVISGMAQGIDHGQLAVKRVYPLIGSALRVAKSGSAVIEATGRAL